MKNRIAFALLMGVVSTGTITFALVAFNLGLGPLFLKVWLRSWGLAYLIVIPVILALGPKLRELTARAFRSTTGGASSRSPLAQEVTFALALGLITTGVISCAVILLNVGFRDDFSYLWLRSWALGYFVVVPLILIVGPAVQRLVDKF